MRVQAYIPTAWVSPSNGTIQLLGTRRLHRPITGCAGGVAISSPSVTPTCWAGSSSSPTSLTEAFRSGFACTADDVVTDGGPCGFFQVFEQLGALPKLDRSRSW